MPTPGRRITDRLTGNLAHDTKRLRKVLEPCGDVAFRPFFAPEPVGLPAVLIYSKHNADKALLQREVLETLMIRALRSTPDAEALALVEQGLPVLHVESDSSISTVTDSVLRGNAALIVEGSATALLIMAKKPAARQVAEPSTESVVRGPREAFVEELEKNLNLIRKRLPTERLRVETTRLGKISRSNVVIVWLDGIADNGIVDEVRNRVMSIKIDAVLDSGYLEEFMEDSPFSPFPQIEHTERTDKLASALLEGRVGVLVDGSPYALMAPALLVHFLQSSEDYYERFILATSVRVIRFGALLISLLAPSFYVAITSIHQEMIPIGLALRLAGTREGAPFPVFVEALLMEAAFEILREAGIRLPAPVGQAVSIVGGLVVGEAAVQAGVANPITVVIVALTGISSFALPAYNLAFSLRLLRFPILAISAAMGLPGLAVACMVLLTHLASLRSFGVPYLSPFGPARFGEWKDAVLRAPWWAMLLRPRMARGRTRRIGRHQKPRPPVGN